MPPRAGLLPGCRAAASCTTARALAYRPGAIFFPSAMAKLAARWTSSRARPAASVHGGPGGIPATCRPKVGKHGFASCCGRNMSPLCVAEAESLPESLGPQHSGPPYSWAPTSSSRSRLPPGVELACAPGSRRPADGGQGSRSTFRSESAVGGFLRKTPSEEAKHRHAFPRDLLPLRVFGHYILAARRRFPPWLLLFFPRASCFSGAVLSPLRGSSARSGFRQSAAARVLISPGPHLGLADPTPNVCFGGNLFSRKITAFTLFPRAPPYVPSRSPSVYPLGVLHSPALPRRSKARHYGRLMLAQALNVAGGRPYGRSFDPLPTPGPGQSCAS